MTLMFLDVFLFQSEFLRSMQHQHLHPDISRNLLLGQLGNDDHLNDGEWYRPDRWLFAKNAEQGMRGPESI